MFADVLVVSHQAVLRCIMAYFKGSKPGKFLLINDFKCYFCLYTFRGNPLYQRSTSHADYC